MTPGTLGPLSRPVMVARLPEGGLDVDLIATPTECAALAVDFGLPELRAFKGRFKITGNARRVRVVGRVSAEIVQICVVSLEPFGSRIEEEVEATFEEADPRARPSGELELDPTSEMPDPIVAGRIDLGTIAAEFLALGLDPHPRKPGVSFAPVEDDASGSVFSDLAKLRDFAQFDPTYLYLSPKPR